MTTTSARSGGPAAGTGPAARAGRGLAEPPATAESVLARVA